MKVALLHYWLTNMRGGERVLQTIASLFEEADIYTHACIRSSLPEFAKYPICESFVSHLPFGRRFPQLYVPLMPTASRRFRLDGYDLIVSSESGPIKGIVKPKHARHICYCHTPMRYVWDLFDEYYRAALFPTKVAMRVFRRYLQNCDLKSAESVDEFIANSRFVAERIRRIYGRDSAVVHPPVDTAYFTTSGKIKYPVFNGEPYYLFVGELRTYKRPQLAIEACLRMNRRLVVIGNGEMRKQLLKMVRGRGKIEFCGGVTRDQLRYGYAHARALIFPGIEDFGMVPVEAQATGTPVLALGEGGALETVRRGETGLFFEDGTVDSLCGCIEEFEAAEFRSEVCRRNALQFSEEVFIEKIKAILCNWH